jgi:hypothetical protein
VKDLRGDAGDQQLPHIDVKVQMLAAASSSSG